MSIPSTYHLQHSLPNRSPGQRPRSLSLSDYQPLSFDREALEAQYQNTIGIPSSSTSSKSNHNSFWSDTTPSTETHHTSSSYLSHQLKAGDNPHGPPPPIQEEGLNNFAGVGAGHSLTPPTSPFHHAGQFQQQKQALSPIPPTPPPLPERQESTVGLMRRGMSDMVVNSDDGQEDRRGKRRALPPRPTNVPEPEPPAWEPDYKSHIPPELTAPSAINAYAQLSAPPPNLPPRRIQPFRQASSHSPPSHHQRLAFTSQYSEPDAYLGESSAGPSAPPRQEPSHRNSGSTSSLPPPPTGAPDYPPNPNAPPPKPKRTRPEAEKEVFLRSEGITPIWSTHILDPSLRGTLAIHQQFTNVANVALSSLATGPKTRYNQTTGAPIDGLAKMAREWVVSPDGRFVTENGGVDLGLGIVDSGLVEGWGKEKGRKRARVEVVSKGGGVKIDVIEIEENRQVDLKVENRLGDVLILLPENYHGPIHVTAPSHPPIFLPSISANLSPPANPYASFYTTHLTPFNPSRPIPNRSKFEHSTASRIERYVPKSFREESEMLNQVVGGYVSHTRGEMDKVSVTVTKGRCVIGYRERFGEGMRGEMVEEWRGTGVKVGVEEGKGKRRRWWRG